MNGAGKVLRAASFAAEAHRGQNRKGRIGDPYINHPIEVSRILAEIGNITNLDILSAALLHDTVEDCDVTFDQIEKLFGARVAGYVRELTDDKTLPKAERKRLQVEHAPKMSRGAKQIKLADKISNIRDVTENPPAGWSNKRRLKYVDWGVAVAAGLRGVNPELEKLFDRTIRAARRAIK